MNRETRANLIFICVFVAVAIPGAVILFKKKLQPGQNMMYLPDTVRRSLPYMDPTPAPAQISRVSPPKTEGWIKGLVAQKLGPESWPYASRPKLSDARMFEVVGGLGVHGGKLLLIIWDTRCRADGRYQVMMNDTATSPLTVEEVALPADVRGELKDQGYIQPPEKVVILITPALSAGRLLVEWRSGEVVIADRTTIPLH